MLSIPSAKLELSYNEIIASCSRAVKDTCYKTMIRPIVEYAAIIWSPHMQSQINNLETVQRKAARFVCNDYLKQNSLAAF